MNTQPKHRPILFSTDMVRAILKGHKTQTRRIMKPQPTSADIEKITDWATEILPACPYGKMGDILWVRETTLNNMTAKYPYRADVCSKHDKPDNTKWKPSIHMPKNACRIFLKITNIRVEKLQNITAEDAINEGVQCNTDARENTMNYKSYISNTFSCFPYVSFLTLWHKINGRHSWDANPWVWVIEFEKCEKPANF